MSESNVPIPGVFRRDGDSKESRERHWTIRDGKGTTDLAKRRMAVPTDDSERSLAIRQHEMLHAAWSPVPHEHGIEMDAAMLAAEDARVETRANNAGLHRESLPPDEIRKSLSRLLKHPSLRSSFAVAAVGSPSEKTVREIVSRQDRKLMDKVKAIYDEDTSFEAAERVAQMLREMEGYNENYAMSPIHMGGMDSDGDDEEEEEEEEKGKRVPGRKPKDWEPWTGFAPPLANGEVPWGTVKIHKPPLVRQLVDEKVVKGRKPRWKDYGTAPGAMHRLTIDEKVFRHRTRARGGTVLIDLSGSMHLEASSVDEFIQKVPAGMVAGYWGDGEGHGTIRVLAADGKAVDRRNLKPSGGANEIDLPAIEWLAKQHGPRFLVFDGAITVTGDTAPSVEQADYYWARLKALGITQVHPNRGTDWIEGINKALRRSR